MINACKRVIEQTVSKGSRYSCGTCAGLSISFDSKIIQACCCLQVVKLGDIVTSPLEEFSTLRTSCLHNWISYTVKKISSWSDVCNPRKNEDRYDVLTWMAVTKKAGIEIKVLCTHNSKQVNLLCTLNNTYPDDLIVPIWHISRQFSCLGKCKIVTWSYDNRSLSNGSQRFSCTCDLPSTFDSAFLDTGSVKPVSPNFILIWKIYVSIREGIQH